jgi:hypothetical protein
MAGVDDQAMNVKLVDQGLYVTSQLGTLRLPSSHIGMRKVRVLLERLFTLKRNLLHFEEFLNWARGLWLVARGS